MLHRLVEPGQFRFHDWNDGAPMSLRDVIEEHGVTRRGMEVTDRGTYRYYLSVPAAETGNTFYAMHVTKATWDAFAETVPTYDELTLASLEVSRLENKLHGVPFSRRTEKENAQLAARARRDAAAAAKEASGQREEELAAAEAVKAQLRERELAAKVEVA